MCQFVAIMGILHANRGHWLGGTGFPYAEEVPRRMRDGFPGLNGGAEWGMAGHRHD